MILKKRGLGRGLDALLGEIGEIPIEQVKSNSLKTLPVEFLQRGKFQPRKDIDPEKLQELASSIKAQGIVQPVVVREIATEQYEIIAGERRWRAAQLAGLYEIPVIISNIDDRAAMAIALIENIQREDLNPLDEAEALKRLISEFEMTHQQIADALGKSRASVTNSLRLIDLEQDVKQLLLKRDLEMGHARAILVLKGQQQVSVANSIVKKGLTVRATEKLVKAIQEGKTANEPRSIDLDTLRLQEQLTQSLGAKVKISHQESGKGNLTISYSSLDELDGIIAKIRNETELTD